MTEENLRRVRTLIAQGLTVRKAAALGFMVSETSLFAVLGDEGVNAPDRTT